MTQRLSAAEIRNASHYSPALLQASHRQQLYIDQLVSDLREDHESLLAALRPTLQQLKVAFQSISKLSDQTESEALKSVAPIKPDWESCLSKDPTLRQRIKYDVAPPTALHLTGTLPLGCLMKSSNIVVDMIASFPDYQGTWSQLKTLLQNGAYFSRRAYHLARLAKALNQVEKVSNIRFSSWRQFSIYPILQFDVKLPTLQVTFQVHYQSGLPENILESHFSPQQGNVRVSHVYHDNETAQAAIQAQGIQDPMHFYPPTPHYNALIWRDMMHVDLMKRYHVAFSNEMKMTLILLQKWGQTCELPLSWEELVDAALDLMQRKIWNAQMDIVTLLTTFYHHFKNLENTGTSSQTNITVSDPLNRMNRWFHCDSFLFQWQLSYSCWACLAGLDQIAQGHSVVLFENVFRYSDMKCSIKDLLVAVNQSPGRFWKRACDYGSVDDAKLHFVLPWFGWLMKQVMGDRIIQMKHDPLTNSFQLIMSQLPLKRADIGPEIEESGSVSMSPERKQFHYLRGNERLQLQRLPSGALCDVCEWRGATRLAILRDICQVLAQRHLAGATLLVDETDSAFDVDISQPKPNSLLTQIQQILKESESQLTLPVTQLVSISDKAAWIHLETSTRWPDHVDAIETTKLMFLLEMKNALTSAGMKVELRKNTLLVENQIHLAIFVERQFQLLGKDQIIDPAAHFFRLIKNVESKVPVFKPALALFEHWLDCQGILLQSKFISLILAHFVLKLNRLRTCPGIAMSVMQQFMGYLSSKSWQRELILLDPEETLSTEDRLAALDRMFASKQWQFLIAGLDNVDFITMPEPVLWWRLCCLAEHFSFTPLESDLDMIVKVKRALTPEQIHCLSEAYSPFALVFSSKQYKFVAVVWRPSIRDAMTKEYSSFKVNSIVPLMSESCIVADGKALEDGFSLLVEQMTTVKKVVIHKSLSLNK